MAGCAHGDLCPRSIERLASSRCQADEALWRGELIHDGLRPALTLAVLLRISGRGNAPAIMLSGLYRMCVSSLECS